MSVPTLTRPDPYRIFYIRLNCSKYVMGVVILQGYASVEARKSESQEKAGGDCLFYKSLEVMRLQPISFIFISIVAPIKNSRHGFVVEAAAIRWAVVNFRNYLRGADLTVLSYCSGLQNIFESESNVPHMVHRGRAVLLQCQILICHRLESMMWE